MSEIKLLSCPFCGVEFTEIDVGESYKMFMHDNGECLLGVFAIGQYEEEKINKWNTRKPMERIVERLEEERENKKTDFLTSCEAWKLGRFIGIEDAIKIAKEEGGIC